MAMGMLLSFTACGADKEHDNIRGTEEATEVQEETSSGLDEEGSGSADESLFSEDEDEKEPSEAESEERDESAKADETEDTVISESEDLHLDNGIFSIDMPKELEGTYIAEISEEGIYILDKTTIEKGKELGYDFPGYVFGIYAYDDPEDYIYEEHYDVLGHITSGDGRSYEVIMDYPTDLQYFPKFSDNYLATYDKSEEIAASLKCTGDYKFTKEGEKTGNKD